MATYTINTRHACDAARLTGHACVQLRLPTSDGLHPWSFAKDGQELTVRIQGRTVFNTMSMMLQAAVDGLGLSSLPEDAVTGLLRKKRLVRVLEDWSSRRPGYHLYYPSRKQPSLAFALVFDALRRYRNRESSRGVSAVP